MIINQQSWQHGLHAIHLREYVIMAAKFSLLFGLFKLKHPDVVGYFSVFI